MRNDRHPAAMRCLAAALLISAHAPAAGAEGPSITAAPLVESVFIGLLDEVNVPAREAGVITALRVRRGSKVVEGEGLAKVDDTAVGLALAEAEAQLSKARHRASNDLKIQLAAKALQAAELELERARQSNARHARSVSQSELDRLMLAAERATLEHEQARLDYEEAQLDLQAAEVRRASARHEVRRRIVQAPLSGMVVELAHRQGEWVEPGQTLLRIVGLDRVSAEGLIAADIPPNALLGRRVRVETEVDGQTVTAGGTIVFVSPKIDPVSKRARLAAEIDNPKQQLRPGMRARMVIVP